MRVPLIAGNWKMNTTVAEALELVRAMKDELEKVISVEKIVCPPFVSLAPVKELLTGSPIKLGAQNLFFAEKGAYTGEISPLMVADLCEYVIIGHSERRQHFHETGDIVNKKIMAALKAGLKPILCIGERLEENESGKTEEVVAEQLSAALVGVAGPDGLAIAYEPVWAIGTGKPATGEQANGTIAFIRQNVAQMCGENVAREMRILYGGSVNSTNAAEFMQQPEIDGALVGGASLKANEFLSIVNQASIIKHSK
ncbi:MAG TPA: triose-phosphate isomerase [Dehalococcoidales bacterium]|nr:triose-phosphate isomerase [Dehalococcoidales bacterium]